MADEPGRNLTIQELQEVSRRHESKLVIEFGTDQIMTWLGVYLIFGLGFVFKVEELFTGNLACYPDNYNESVSKSFIQFASVSCWEIPQSTKIAQHCSARDEIAERNNVICAVKIIPYILFAHAFLALLPTVCWYLLYGSPLLGHLKLIKFILKNTCKAISKVKTVPSTGKPYDKNSVHLIGS